MPSDSHTDLLAANSMQMNFDESVDMTIELRGRYRIVLEYVSDGNRKEFYNR
jgi:hypothetical protein